MVSRTLIQCTLFGLLAFAALAAIPDLNVPQCPKTASISKFQLSSGAGLPSEATTVAMCWQNSGLVVNVHTVDNYTYSPYTKCNENLFNADVIEMFVTADDLEHYYEFEVSPKGVAFVSTIVNPSGDCSKFRGDLAPCSIFRYSAAATSVGYDVHMELPWNLFASKSDLASGVVGKPKSLRANLFRIDVLRSGAKEYAAWSPNYKSPACFHVPRYFGVLNLV